MADPVIDATVQILLEKLLSLTIEEAKSSRNCKKNLRMLTKYISMIQAFIHDAERRQVNDQAVEEWLKMLERVAEDAENVFDEISNIGNIQVFLSLKKLVLKDMCSLIEWKGDEVGVRMFSGLEKLKISKCPLLKSTPSQFEILRELEIDGVVSEMPLLNLCSNLTSLVKLNVYYVKELTCFPDEMLRNNVSLQHLSVFDCREFRELPQSLYNLHSLKSLEIISCPKFSSFPVPSGENYLTSLQSLELSNCYGLTSLPSGMLEQCRSLEILRVSHCNNLVSFPLHLGEMPSLSELIISECPKLISVPAGGASPSHQVKGIGN